MPKLVGLACLFTFMIFVSPQNDRFSKYKHVEAYEIRPGVLMMPRYSADGQVCEIGLDVRHYAPDLITLDIDLSDKQIDQLVDELAPPGERGPRSEKLLGDLIEVDGVAMTTTREYENVWVQSYRKVSTSRRKTVASGIVAVTIDWKNRNCQ